MARRRAWGLVERVKRTGSYRCVACPLVSAGGDLAWPRWPFYAWAYRPCTDTACRKPSRRGAPLLALGPDDLHSHLVRTGPWEADSPVHPHHTLEKKTA